jgi:hypothetical protein
MTQVPDIACAAVAELPFEIEDINLSYHFDYYVGDDERPARYMQLWHVTATYAEWDDEVGTSTQHPLGMLDVVVIDCDRALDDGRSGFDLLDVESGDLATIGAEVFDIRSGWLRDSVRDALGDDNFGSQLIVLDRVRVEPQHRGHGLGPILAGLVLDTLRIGSSAFSACYPAPFEGDLEGADRERAIDSLTRTWAKLGFQELSNGVHVLDLNCLDEALVRLGVSSHHADSEKGRQG